MDVLRDIMDAVRNYATDRRYVTPTLIRMLRAAGLVAVTFFAGTVGFLLLDDSDANLLDAAYMTVITLSTVGYGEIIPVTPLPEMQIFTIALVIAGSGTVLYFFSAMTAFIVDGELRKLLRERRMARDIDNLSNHYVVAGIGETGEYVLGEILQSERDCVVIDRDRERIEEVQDELDTSFPFICGDATDDDTLEEAGVQRAEGLVCSLGSDRDNLFVTISARSLNDQLQIVTRGAQPESEHKFKKAGATSVIYTNVLGGMRMAAEAIRPQVTSFLDLMMQDHGHYRRVEEIDIPDDSPFIGKPIKETPIRQHTDALIIAVYDCEEGDYHFNPGGNYELSADSRLIVLTLIEDLPTLEDMVEPGF